MASRLSQMQARFQQKQMQEKEEKLLKMYESQQQRAFERVGRSSAGSNSSVTTTTIAAGKVRQMFDERRQKAGIDRSYPLEPIKNTITNNNIRTNTNRTTSLDRKNTRSIPIVTQRVATKTTVQKSFSSVQKTTKPLVAKREVPSYNNNSDEFGYDEEDSYLRQENEMVTLMNNHNLGDGLDDEEMPQIGFDDEEDIFTGKLANVGGKLPSQNVPVARKATPPKKSNGLAKTNSIAASKDPKQNQLRSTNRQSPKQRPSSGGSLGSAGSSSTSSHTSSPQHHQASAEKMKNTVPVSNRPSKKVPNSKAVSNSTVIRDDLTSCRYCQRRFATDRIHVHEDICSKTAKKKRKTYDATKHRVAGTELEPFVGKKTTKTVKNGVHNEATTKTTTKAKTSTPSKNNWRQKHEEFIAAIRAAKQAQAYVAKGGNLKDLPPPPPSSNADYVQCPHCGRKFNEAAAERHIPKCATYEFNKPKSKPPAKR